MLFCIPAQTDKRPPADTFPARVTGRTSHHQSTHYPLSAPAFRASYRPSHNRGGFDRPYCFTITTTTSSHKHLRRPTPSRRIHTLWPQLLSPRKRMRLPPTTASLSSVGPPRCSALLPPRRARPGSRMFRYRRRLTMPLPSIPTSRQWCPRVNRVIGSRRSAFEAGPIARSGPARTIGNERPRLPRGSAATATAYPTSANGTASSSRS